ncbi:MAG: aminofutalosine synthase MqnE [Planctomycetota bacterium]|nr:MAG: aminofutalosine synthase MqnE [Planctomycetota bacterium]
MDVETIKEYTRNSDISDIIRKALEGERLSAGDGLRLFESSDLTALGIAANAVRERLHGKTTYYVVNRHINYSNICENRCRFCAFSRSRGEDGAYEMSLDEIIEAAESARGSGVTEFHIVGGLHPDYGFDYYEKMMSELHERFPDVHLQCFTAVEIAHFAKKGGMSTRECLSKLKDAGLGSLPGGGAEVFSTRVRNAVCPEKLSGDDWLRIMAEAHELGLKSNATMLYGHVETPQERIEHMIKLRDLQDETGGFQAFIPLAFHPWNTELESESRGPTGVDDLKALAIGRLMLDNFPHVKAFWIMLGLKLAQVSLSFGVDDLDGTVVQEKITHMAGAQTPERLTVDEIVHLIREAGYEPVERDTIYNIITR